MNRKSGFRAVSISIIAVFVFSLSISLIRLIELMIGIERHRMYNDIQYWLSLLIIDLIFLLSSIFILFILVKESFFSNIEEEINRLNKFLKFLVIFGIIIMLPYIFIDTEFNTPMGLTLIILVKLGWLSLVMGLGLLMVDHIDRRKKNNLKEK